MSRPPSISKGHRSVAAIAVACLMIGGVTVGVRASYGLFDDTVEVAGTFPRAGQSLNKGSDVLYRGVPVGEVRRIELVGQDVRITLALEPDAEIPTDVEAVVAPKTLFGEKSVELRGGTTGGDTLEAGDELIHTRAGTEVEELIAAADPVLRGIDTTELAGLMTELTQVLQGHGRRFNAALEPTVAAAGLFEETLDAQLRLLESSAAFAEQIRDIGPGLNGVAANLDVLLPTLNQARGDFVRFLRTLRPLADNLAEILVTVRPDIDRLLTGGVNISRLLIAREDELADTVNGLAVYLQTLAEGVSRETFDDGTKAAFFKVFVVLDDLNAMLCALVNPGVDLPPELAGVLDQLSEGLVTGTGMVDCDAPYGGDEGSPPVPTPAEGGSGVPSIEDLAQPYYQGAATPDPSTATGGLDTIVEGALPAPGAGEAG
ncbi:MCE family protein [Iamia sp. SCSIO 61187]|uniref:MlaD family protein n=1 Tax=Iamia sp. SCSIO 61187 TaxID=2722752 RepID=UPI001C62C7D3|nr:MlaD family protein [Iamia sp. SCSIO 61187]QYG92926.1 MCE family protein [Iamia sp. SCSIO 61187]